MTEQGASILVVEDSPINQRQLQALLSKQGYRVLVANHGKEALDLLAHERPDLLLLDVVMPELDGLALCRILKKDPVHCEIPVIFISSLDNTADKLSGFSAGGVDYITKPFHPSEVLARIATHLKIRQLQKQLAENNRQLVLEKQKSESLLLNVLPARVAQELMERGSCTPQYFSEVTVGFVDIVQFTATAASLDSSFVISELNELFTAFDRIVEKYQCERMKTIGDAYLFASGIPEPRKDHSRAAALVAIDMIGYLKERNQNCAQTWEIRIGLHAGPVVGGIVGTKKYIYDIFGDTVNIAARLESLSLPMRINVSQAFCKGLEDEFRFSCPLSVEMKGKGTQAICFLEGVQNP
ncbi:response regulator [Desulfobulbus rhabdoformis]|uniref:adenylate/guanylate cyclase domain-containing protein n=1 Tax=Desulfobulbus rhabdoformis TaxID=34032 RepID=UPI0019638BD2|nr:response regulator [Desulfobulbus rhabdoformis]